MKMKMTLKILSLAAGLVLLGGCASQPIPFERTEVITPSGATNIVYSVSSAVSNALATAEKLNSSFVPAPFNGAVETALGLVVLVLGGIARYKTQQAAKERAAADLLASHIVKTGTATQALQTALTTPAAQKVAEHIDNNTAY